MKLVSTNRDLTVWIMAIIWFIINFGTMMIWGNFALVFTNPICLLILAVFVFYSKHNQKFDNWLNKKI